MSRAGVSRYTPDMNEIIFLVEEAPEGGYTARALGARRRRYGYTPAKRFPPAGCRRGPTPSWRPLSADYYSGSPGPRKRT